MSLMADLSCLTRTRLRGAAVSPVQFFETIGWLNKDTGSVAMGAIDLGVRSARTRAHELRLSLLCPCASQIKTSHGAIVLLIEKIEGTAATKRADADGAAVAKISQSLDHLPSILGSHDAYICRTQSVTSSPTSLPSSRRSPTSQASTPS